MGVDWKIDGGCVAVVITDKMSFQSLIGGLEQMIEDPNLPERACLLIDVTASETLPSFEGMEKIAQIIAGAKDRLSGRVAVVVSQDLRFGRARQLEAMLAPYDVELEPFFDRDQALAWLGGGPLKREG